MSETGVLEVEVWRVNEDRCYRSRCSMLITAGQVLRGTGMALQLMRETGVGR